MLIKSAAFTRTAVGTGIALIALTAVAGCGGAKGTGTAGAAGAPTHVDLSPVAAIQAMLTKASGSDNSVSVRGTVTFAKQQATMTAQERFGSDFGMQMDLSVAGQDVSVVFDGKTMYMKDQQLASLLNGKQWLSMSLADAGSAGAALSSEMQGFESQNPVEQFQAMLASDDLKDVGSESVDGVQAEHYSGTVNPATSLSDPAVTKNLTPAEITSLKSMFKATGVTSEHLDVWVASSGLPVEMKQTTTTAIGNTNADLHFSQWGAPVTITVPPAGEVTDLSSMLGKLGSTSS